MSDIKLLLVAILIAIATFYIAWPGLDFSCRDGSIENLFTDCLTHTTERR